MAIKINKPRKDTVNPPVIKVTGYRIDAQTGQIGQSATISIGSQQVEQDGLVVSKREEIVFKKEVTVSLIPDAEFKVSPYGYLNNQIKPYNEVTRSELAVLGKNISGLSKNEKSETYYTLNGKDPIRTKANIYTGSFKIRRNSSGDNTILKTRTYVQGYKSKVRTVELRIVKSQNTREV